MDILADLSAISGDPQAFEFYVRSNYLNIYEYFAAQNQAALFARRGEIDAFIKSKRRLLEALDLGQSKVWAFLLVLLDIADRLRLPSIFQSLFSHLHNHAVPVSRRLQAAKLHIVDVKTAEQLFECIETICDLLDTAEAEERENMDLLVFSIGNFYASIVLNFGVQNMGFVLKVREALLERASTSTSGYFKQAVVGQILSLEIQGSDEAQQQIFSLLDAYLGRTESVHYVRKNFVIESDSEYAKHIADQQFSFDVIRSYAVEEHNDNPNSKAAFLALDRGVAILKEQAELHAYLHAFGPMHKAKLVSAFKSLPEDAFAGKIMIVDWGCGQGIATVLLREYLDNRLDIPSISSILLIEPSELALSRAALHVGKSIGNLPITQTIHSGFDELNAEDLINIPEVKKIHLFSNVLDVDQYKLSHLITMIKSSFLGENWFVCVSPCMSGPRLERINAFVDAFRGFDGFELVATKDNQAGSWQQNWTRTLRVFKVMIA
jgi:hypothetical protein